jgi:hypothetical protein
MNASIGADSIRRSHRSGNTGIRWEILAQMTRTFGMAFRRRDEGADHGRHQHAAHHNVSVAGLVATATTLRRDTVFTYPGELDDVVLTEAIKDLCGEAQQRTLRSGI